MIFAWVHVVLIFCFFIASSQTENNGDVRVACVSENATVTVPCPALSLAAQEEKTIYYLYKGHVKVRQHKLNATEKAMSFQLAAGERAVGGYTCVAERVYPPPLQRVCSSTVLLLLRGQQCPAASVDCTEAPAGKDTTCVEPGSDVWLWALGLGVTATLGMASAIAAMVFWVRLRSAESYQNDYINAKPIPRGPQGRKRGGVQYPAPKRF